jgi:hypothetical protein
MHPLQVIPEELTMWHIKLMHILAAIAFFGPARFEF